MGDLSKEYTAMMKMKIISAAAALSSLLAPISMAHATGTFDNNAFSVSYVFGPSGAAAPWETTSVTGNSAMVELADFWSWQIDTAGNDLSLTWNKEGQFMNNPAIAPFIGFRISDTGDQLADILGVSITNTAYTPSTYGNLIEGFGASNLTFDADNIYINLNTSMWHDFDPAPGQMGDKFRDTIALDVNFQTSPIPEPEAYAMLLAGLGLLATMSRRRRVRGG